MLQWNGAWLVAVSPRNTSRTCPNCGYVSADNRRTRSRFLRVCCGFEENANVVGAINLLRVRQALFACEVSDAVMSRAAGTHRSGTGGAPCLARAPWESSSLQGKEDVNSQWL